MSLSSLLLFVHMVGLGLAVGAATAKFALILKCRTNPASLPVHFGVSGLLTRQIIAGMVLLLMSGVGWMAYGYAFTPRLVLKILLFAAIFALGITIDNVVEPQFKRLAPAHGEAPSPEFLNALNRFVVFEAVATLLFYVVIFIWVRA